jgi:hypothetical protein
MADHAIPKGVDVVAQSAPSASATQRLHYVQTRLMGTRASILPPVGGITSQKCWSRFLNLSRFFAGRAASSQPHHWQTT